jgi:hypothetical protein
VADTSILGHPPLSSLVTTVQVHIRDLSLGGCLLEAPFTVRTGRRFTLRLDLPGDEWISLRAETVRIQAPTTFAVKFLDLDDTTENRLRQALERASNID